MRPELLKIKSILSRVELLVPPHCPLNGMHTFAGISSLLTAPLLRCDLVEAQSGLIIPVKIESFSNPQIDLGSNDAWTSYKESAFRATIDLLALRTATPIDVQQPEWYVRLSLQLGDVILQSCLEDRTDFRCSRQDFPLPPAHGDRRFVCRFSGEYGLSLTTVTHPRFVETFSLEDRVLTVSAVVAPGERASRLLVECPALRLSVIARPIGADGTTVFRAAIPKLPAHVGKTKEHIWKVRVRQATSCFITSRGPEPTPNSVTSRHPATG